MRTLLPWMCQVCLRLPVLYADIHVLVHTAHIRHAVVQYFCIVTHESAFVACLCVSRMLVGMEWHVLIVYQLSAKF